jgi:predicted ArsR family transcriptional regulator
MKIPQWNRRFLASTRGHIIGLLRGSSRTVNELAEALELTDNAVRSHLATLERDGLVQQSGTRPGLRKPHFVYALTPEAEHIFPKSYGAILNHLLDVLNEQLPAGETEKLLREVGRRLAADTAVMGGAEQRAQVVADVFRSLGGLAEVENRDGAYFIRGDSCPLGAVTSQHPQVCRMAEALISEIMDAPVQTHCKRGDMPQCCFEIRATRT